MPTPGQFTFVTRAASWPDRLALIATDGSATYGDLLAQSQQLAQALRSRGLKPGDRVAYLIPPSIQHVAVQWAVWRAGGIAVPLALSHPLAEHAHVLRDAGATFVVCRSADQTRFAELELTGTVVSAEALASERRGLDPLPEDDAPTSPALMIYTSGTTGKPKGVVTTHANLDAQIQSLHEAWEWSRDDRVLLVLPLHHIHGVVNVVSSCLWAGACCEMMARFDAHQTWDRLASGDCTVFMAVPTIYRKLCDTFAAAPTDTQRGWTDGSRGLRLMVSGSAALPVAVHDRWEQITGHRLLERYGMTEIGMALSNPLHGDRRPGTVGQPLPGVEVRLERFDPEEPGEIQVRGPTVFREYWNRPEETKASFDGDWFRTGDIAVVEDDYYRILGRNSVDIIKSGGYKISALEIEEVCRTHPAIAECAVVGLKDDEWGERVCIAVEAHRQQDLDLDALMQWASKHLAPYKIPRRLRLVEALPRNAMGKVLKPAVKKMFTS